MNSISRRHFNVTAGAGVASLYATSVFGQPTAEETDMQTTPLAIATWSFGLDACHQAYRRMQEGGDRLDGVEAGIRLTEADRENRSVGAGGIPNAAGVVQLDACIMDGPGQRAGAVAALENYPHPISVARRVLEKTPHVMLVGEGAAEFAKVEGFQTEDLLEAREREAYAKWKAKRRKPQGGIDPVAESDAEANADPDDDRKLNHDTIALLTRDAKGVVAGGCSTSGWGYKLPGRVGDSPIIGSGLYVDGRVGAAGATGLGEIVMRYCGSFLVVESMRRGASPEEACIEAVERIIDGEGKSADQLSLNFVAMNTSGAVGAAGTDVGFRYAIVTKDIAEVRLPTIVR